MVDTLKKESVNMRYIPVTADKDRAICKWAWIEALKVVADHIDEEGNIDKDFAKDIKRYVEARR